MKIDVLLTFEHKARELESILLIDEYLQKWGLSTCIAQWGWSAEYAFLFYRPKVLVVPWFYNDNTFRTFQHYAGSLEDGTLEIVNMRCEQVITAGSADFHLPHGVAKKAFHLSWGDNDAKSLLSAGVDEGHVVVTGSPRLDFYRPPFDAVSPGKRFLGERYGLDRDAEWILVAANFSGAFMSDERIAELDAEGMSGMGEMRDISRRSFTSVREWLGFVADELEPTGRKIELIYRPHPSEPISQEVLDLESQHRSIHVIKDRAVRDWILASQRVLIWTSTSFVEAVVAGKPVYAMRPFEIPDEFAIPLVENVKQLHSKESLLAALVTEGAEGENAYVGELLEQIAPYYSVGERPACEVTANLICTIVEAGGRGSFAGDASPLFGLTKMTRGGVKLVLRKAGLIERLLPGSAALSEDYVDAKTMTDSRAAIRKAFMERRSMEHKAGE